MGSGLYKAVLEGAVGFVRDARGGEGANPTLVRLKVKRADCGNEDHI